MSESNLPKNKIKSPELTDKTPAYWKDHGFVNIFWTFVFASVLGTLIETIWCIVVHNKLQSRAGLVYGPFNLVYGIGAILMITVLYDYKDNGKIFLVSAVVGTGFELFCSFFTERAFGTVSWDYTNTPLNFQGRINLALTFCWGILGLAFMTNLFPHINKLITRVTERFSKNILTAITACFAIFMVFNVIFSFGAVHRQAQRRENIPASNSVQVFFDQRFPDERLEKIFPSMEAVPNSTFSQRTKIAKVIMKPHHLSDGVSR